MNRGDRLRSLDAFRGLAIAGMILVNNPGSWSHVYAPLRHADWHGWTPTDLVFPFFLFIVGVALPFSFEKRRERGDSRRRLMGHVGRRSGVLFLLGLFMAAFPWPDLATLRIMGVLQRIGLVYLMAAAAYLFLGPRVRWMLAGAVLLGYWGLLAWIPVPGFGAGDLSMEGNLPAYLDRLTMGGRLWQGTWDPEGLLSTAPAVCTTLLGIATGEWLRTGRSPEEKTVGLFVAGALGLVIGWAWHPLFPINKNLWTSSYVVFTAGIALQGLALCYWTIDVRGRSRWAEPLVVYGMNALAVFVASGLVAKSMALTDVQSGPGAKSLTAWVYETLFASWAGPLNGSLAFALTYVATWWWLMWLLHRRGVHIKI